METLLQINKKQLLIFGSHAELNSKPKTGILKAVDYLLTYLLAYLLTYLLTCLLHGSESFLRR